MRPASEPWRNPVQAKGYDAKAGVGPFSRFAASVRTPEGNHGGCPRTPRATGADSPTLAFDRPSQLTVPLRSDPDPTTAKPVG